SKSGWWSALSGRVNGGTLDRCPAPLQIGRASCREREKGREEEGGSKVLGNQDAIAQRQSSLPTVQTVTPLTRWWCQPTIRHHPPGNFDSLLNGLATSELGRIFCSCRQLQGDFGDGRVTTGQWLSQGLSKSGWWSALSGRVNGGTLDRCPAPL